MHFWVLKSPRIGERHPESWQFGQSQHAFPSWPWWGLWRSGWWDVPGHLFSINGFQSITGAWKGCLRPLTTDACLTFKYTTWFTYQKTSRSWYFHGAHLQTISNKIKILTHTKFTWESPTKSVKVSLDGIVPIIIGTVHFKGFLDFLSDTLNWKWKLNMLVL